MWNWIFRARLPSKSEWKMWKRSFRARLPSKGESGRCGNEAFVRDCPQKVKVEDVETKLSCETALKRWKWKMWKWSFRGLQILKVQVVKMTPELAVPLRGRSENDPTLTERVSQPSAGQASPSIFRDWFCLAKRSILCIRYLSKRISCETSCKNWKLKMWKRSFRARLPFKIWKRKMWKRSFRARLPSKSESGRCGSKAFVQDFLQNPKVEDVITKLSCETSFKIWNWKLSCHAMSFHSIPIHSNPFQSNPFHSNPIHFFLGIINIHNTEVPSSFL